MKFSMNKNGNVTEDLNITLVLEYNTFELFIIKSFACITYRHSTG